MSDFQRQLCLVSLGVFAATGLLTWSITSIRYRITAKRLLVTWLGLPVRWIRLENIKHIGTRPGFWTERWPNVLFENGRTLVIRRKRGLVRSLLITPKYPFEFKASLELARETALRSAGHTDHPQPPSQPVAPPKRPNAAEA
jgi:hypothetical protein